MPLLLIGINKICSYKTWKYRSTVNIVKKSSWIVPNSSLSLACNVHNVLYCKKVIFVVVIVTGMPRLFRVGDWKSH